MINAKTAFWLGIIVTSMIGIGGGTVSLTHAIPDAYIPNVVAWCNVLSFLGSAALTACHAWSAPGAGPFVNLPAPPVVPLKPVA